MVNYNRLMAGAFVGAGALILIWKGNVTEGCTLLGGMLGFFVGEANGKKIKEGESK